METREFRRIKILKEGDAKFYIKRIDKTSRDGSKLITRNGEEYIKILFRVTDSEGTSEDIMKIIVLSWDRDILKFLRSIGRIDLKDQVKSKNFDWTELEDESGICRLETENNPTYGERTNVASFVKKQAFSNSLMVGSYPQPEKGIILCDSQIPVVDNRSESTESLLQKMEKVEDDLPF